MRSSLLKCIWAETWRNPESPEDGGGRGRTGGDGGEKETIWEERKEEDMRGQDGHETSEEDRIGCERT